MYRKIVSLRMSIETKEMILMKWRRMLIVNNFHTGLYDSDEGKRHGDDDDGRKQEIRQVVELLEVYCPLPRFWTEIRLLSGI